MIQIETKLDCFMWLMSKKFQCGDTDASVATFVAGLVFTLDTTGLVKASLQHLWLHY